MVRWPTCGHLPWGQSSHPRGGNRQLLTARPVPRIPLGDGMKRRLLLIEDDAALRTATAYMLRASYEVVLAATAGAAVERLRSAEPFDVIVADVTLPDGPVEHLAAELERLRADAPVIWVSGHDLAEIELRLGTAPQHCLRKPYRIDDLERLMEKALAPAPPRPDVGRGEPRES